MWLVKTDEQRKVEGTQGSDVGVGQGGWVGGGDAMGISPSICHTNWLTPQKET